MYVTYLYKIFVSSGSTTNIVYLLLPSFYIPVTGLGDG